MAQAIEIKGLTKVYTSRLTKTKVVAVDDLNLEVQEGEIFGFLGPNGAGKTTTIKMLLGLLFPTAGSAVILGKPIGDIEIKAQISYLPESPYFYEYMTGREVLDFYARLFRMDTATRNRRVLGLLERVGMKDSAGKPLREYSKGMLQRIGVAQALLNDPKVLFLDEPTSGLDPLARKDIRDLIVELRGQGKTVFLSSHQLQEVEMVCDRVAILDHGKLRMVGDLEDLLAKGGVEVTAAQVSPELAGRIREIADRVETTDKTLVAYNNDEKEARKIIQLILSSDAALVSVSPMRRTLEHLFVETIKEEAK